MSSANHIKKIVISGPESTGKTTLSEHLAKAYNTICIPEFARKYIEEKSNKYTYEDVEDIAKNQINELTKEYNNVQKFIFFDTGLIITKVWFQEVFDKVPDFILKAIEMITIDMCLLCYPDIKWVPDSVRENNGKKRFDLFAKYQEEYERYNINYKIIQGSGEARFQYAKKLIYSAYCL